MRSILLSMATLFSLTSFGQLVIDNATFFIGEGAVVTVQGNLTTNVAIQAGGAGATLGKIQLKGTSQQQINTNGFVIPRLEMDNTTNAILTGDVKVGNTLELTNGIIQLANFNFILEEATQVVGAGTSKFLETTGTGQARRLTGANVADKIIPVGSGTAYTPFKYTTTGATYGAGAYVGVMATGVAVPSPQRHPRTESFLGTSWKVNKSGITGGNLVAVGTYADAQITGTEADIRGFSWNGSTWSLTGGTQDVAANTVGTDIAGASGELYGMNKFILVNPTVMLQGPFDATTGLMRDLLRSTDAVQTPGNPSTNNLIPTSDPYRTAGYSATFPHVSNANAEVIAASVLNHKANPNENIVDWVFIQLRKSTGATTAPIAQTRSALIRRDGKIVDIDGVSPLYFKNEDAAANYVITIRHRNHLSMSVNPANTLSLGLASTDFDFSNTANNLKIMGTPGTHFVQGGAPTKNLVWGGNATGNGFTRFIGTNGPGSANISDRDQLLLDLSGSQLGVVSNTYTKGDINLNRVTRLVGNNGPAASALGDGNFLLNMLGGNQLEVRSQILPGN
jgi:hypothetical protein